MSIAVHPGFVFGLSAFLAFAAHAQEPSLAEFYGFDGLEIVKIDRGAGPVTLADMNNDGLLDLVVVNNFASRIEIHYQKKNASPDEEFRTTSRVNELPEHWRFRRESISVTHQVAAVVPHDFDGDGLMDLIYGGSPAEIVFMRQTSPGEFQISRRHPVRNLGANRNAFAVANVMGDTLPELISLVNGKINIWPMNGDALGQPTELAAGAPMIAFVIEDYNGDGLLDIAGIIPDNAAPVRLWFGAKEAGMAQIGPQVRFEMPPLREFEPVRLPNDPAARIAVIERTSKRIVLYEVATEEIEETGDRNVALDVYSFIDAGNRKRSCAIVDVDGDRLLDLVATNTESNSIVVYRQVKGKGLQPGESYPSLSDIDYLAAGNIDDDPYAEIFVLSEKEGVVGICHVDENGIPFPQPLSIPDGHTPVSMNLVELEHGPHVATVARSGREYYLYLIDMQGQSETIPLGQQSRAPETIMALDADQDGLTDLLLFTRDRPMTMLQAIGEGEFKLLESKDMGQFGLVQAANALNTAAMDIDGDGLPELLVADKNFVRALRYETTPLTGVSPGWQVVRQINANDPSSKLVSIALLENRIVAADKENSRLIVLGQADPDAHAAAATSAGSAAGMRSQSPAWRQLESLNVRGFSFNAVYAGSFGGDNRPNILAIGDDGFAVIKLAGERIALQQFAAWRTDQDRRLQHELTAGDINSDGFTDLVSLDAGEQMCELFTFTESNKLLYVTGFKVFESKLFMSGESREYQPSQCLIADVTGDGANDIILLCHDRILIYPQMTEQSAAAAQASR